MYNQTRPAGNRITARSCLRRHLLPGLLALAVTAPAALGDWVLSEASRAELLGWLVPPLVADRTAVVVADASQGRRLLAQNPALPLVPASTVKLYVGAVALSELGPDFRFETPVLSADTYLADGVLNGDLCLAGRGDPTWTEATLEEIIQRLHQCGVKRITGSVVCDDSLFGADRTGKGWSPADLKWYYAPESSAVCLNSNRVNVSVSPGAAAGSAATVALTPEAGYLSLASSVRTIAAGGQAAVRFDRDPASRTIRVEGSIPAGASTLTQGMSVPRPALHAAYYLHRRLQEAQIAVAKSPLLGRTPARSSLLLVIRSGPLTEVVARMQKVSDNHIAEQLLRTLGHRCQGEGTAAAGLATVTAFLDRHSIAFEGCHLADGSGLSRENRLTASGLTSLLTVMRQRPVGEVFAETLAVAGADGTLSRRMNGTPAARVIWGKTGTLRGVCCLAGYAFPDKQPPLVFAFLANGYPGGATAVRKLQDGFCASLIAAASTPPAP